jgi:hypothetical protein
MMNDPTLNLSAVLGDPSRAASLPRELLPAAFSHVSAVMAALAGAATAPVSAERAEPNDRLLTLEQAAALANVSVRWLRRHRDLPFFVQLSKKNLRVSETRLRRWLERRAGR